MLCSRPRRVTMPQPHPRNPQAGLNWDEGPPRVFGQVALTATLRSKLRRAIRGLATRMITLNRCYFVGGLGPQSMCDILGCTLTGVGGSIADSAATVRILKKRPRIRSFRRGFFLSGLARP